MLSFIGDTHGQLHNFERIYNDPNLKPTTVIQVGDFGFIWDASETVRESELIKTLNEMPFDICFIDGNHENFTRLLSDEFPTIERYGNKVKQISKNIFYLMRGLSYNIEGYKILCFGGADSIDKERRQEYISWWKEEQPSLKDYNQLAETLSRNIEYDFVITHCAPTSIAKNFFENNAWFRHYIPSFTEDTLEEHIKKLVKTKRWFFGHYHHDVKKTIDGIDYNCLWEKSITYLRKG